MADGALIQRYKMMNEGNIPEKKVGEETEEVKIILEEWKTVIKTQMHFNEMIMRARTTGISVVVAVYGAAALAYGQYPARFITMGNVEFHVSTAIIIFGLLLLIGIFCIDRFYYFRLLLGAVERGEEIDKAFNDRIIGGTKIFGLSTAISNKVSRKRATICLVVFYGLPSLMGIISLIYLACYYCPN